MQSFQLNKKMVGNECLRSLMANKFRIMQGISVQFVSSVTARSQNSKDKR